MKIKTRNGTVELPDQVWISYTWNDYNDLVLYVSEDEPTTFPRYGNWEGLLVADITNVREVRQTKGEPIEQTPMFRAINTPIEPKDKP